jgi:HSP20 family molecular chaperone IbpA
MNYSELSKLFFSFVLTFTVVGLSHPSYADETSDLKNQIKALQQKVDDLEKQLSNQTTPTQRPTVRGPVNAYTFDPFAQMEAMEQQMNQMMKDNMVDFNPREDVKQTPDAYLISMDLPGMDKQKINVEIKNGMLIVSGDRTSEVKEDKPNKFYRQERSFGHFSRVIALPEDAKADSIDAQYNNGVLTVKVARNKNSNAAQSGQKIQVK